MKNTYSISIPKPCGEDWNTFTPKDNGRHCGTCNKVVIDFTALSDRQILEFLQNKKSHTCGRFRLDQMKTYEHWMTPQVNPGLSLMKAGFMSLIFALISNESSAQESTTVRQELTTLSSATAQRISSTPIPGIKGIVREAETGVPLAGVNVLIGRN